MKKINLLFLIIAIIYTSGKAQNLPSSYLSLSIGSSHPNGVYAGSNNVSTSGFATKGTVLAFEHATFIGGGFGWGSVVSFAFHPLNTTRLRNEMIKEGDYGANFTPGNINGWNASCVMAGPVYGVRAGKF